jgi:hypothetical protein
MIEEIVSILVPQTGYCYSLIRSMQNAGKEKPEIEKTRVSEILEENRKKSPTSI